MVLVFVGWVAFLFALQSRRLFIPFVRTKETKQRKTAGYRYEAKILLTSLSKKKLASLRQLFAFNGKEAKFLHASSLKAGI